MAFNDPAVVAQQYEDEANLREDVPDDVSLTFRVIGRSTIFVATK